MRPIQHAALVTYMRMVDEYCKLITTESVPNQQIPYVRDGLHRLISDLSPPQESDKLLPVPRKESSV